MFEYTINNCEFLNEFYKEFKSYIIKSYEFSTQYLVNDLLMEKYKKHEQATLIIINKSIFQNLFNTFTQFDNNMIFSALSCLENALYNVRLFNVLKSNQNNLYKYIKNDGFDLNQLEEIIQMNTDSKDFQEFSVKDFYKHIKSITHFDDINEILPMQINKGNLYLGLSNGNELSDELQNRIRGFMVSTYKALNIHNQMFFNGGLDKDFEDADAKLFNKFIEYVKIYA